MVVLNSNYPLIHITPKTYPPHVHLWHWRLHIGAHQRTVLPASSQTQNHCGFTWDMRTVPTLSTHLSLRVMHVAVVSTSLGIAKPEFTLLRCLLSVLPLMILPKTIGTYLCVCVVHLSSHTVRRTYLTSLTYLNFKLQTWLETFSTAVMLRLPRHHPQGPCWNPPTEGERDSNYSTILPSSKHQGMPFRSHISASLSWYYRYRRELMSCFHTLFPSFQRRIAQVLHQPVQASHRCCTWSPARTVQVKQPREAKARHVSHWYLPHRHICRCASCLIRSNTKRRLRNWPGMAAPLGPSLMAGCSARAQGLCHWKGVMCHARFDQDNFWQHHNYNHQPGKRC